MIAKAIKILFNSLVLTVGVGLIGIYLFQPVLPSMMVSQYEIVTEYEATENKFTLKQIPVCHEVTYSTYKWFGDGKPDDIFRRKVMSRQTLANYCKKDSK